MRRNDSKRGSGTAVSDRWQKSTMGLVPGFIPRSTPYWRTPRSRPSHETISFVPMVVMNLISLAKYCVF